MIYCQGPQIPKPDEGSLHIRTQKSLENSIFGTRKRNFFWPRRGGRPQGLKKIDSLFSRMGALSDTLIRILTPGVPTPEGG